VSISAIVREIGQTEWNSVQMQMRTPGANTEATTNSVRILTTQRQSAMDKVQDEALTQNPWLEGAGVDVHV
jgi:hypothetical protein